MLRTALVLVALVVALCNAHLCLVNPTQRGVWTEDALNSEADNSCIKLDSPCGGDDAADPQVVFEAGANFTLVFQKNLNHYNADAPGNFTVTYFDSPSMKDGTVMFTTADTNTSSLTIYTPSFKWPS